MPIAGLTDDESLAPRYPFLGYAKKGAAKGEDGQVGKDLEYFRFVPRPGPGSDEIAAAFLKIYGPVPSSLDVYLPLDTIHEVFPTWRVMYGQNRLLKLRCDGRNWRYWLEGWKACHGEKPCTFEYCDPANRCPDCSADYVGRLSVILTPMWEAGYVGLVTVLTHGINDLVYIGGILKANEPLTGKEFKVYREPQVVGAPVKKQNKRIAVEKWMVRVALTKNWVMRQLDAQKAGAAALLAAQAGGVVIDPSGQRYYQPGEPPPEEEPPGFDDEPEDGVFVEGDSSSDPEGPTPKDRKPAAAPSHDDPARLDRENKPGEGDDWSVFYPWAARGGYSSKVAFAIIKAHHPGATTKKMPSIPEAVGALLADEDFRLSGENGDGPEDTAPESKSDPEPTE